MTERLGTPDPVDPFDLPDWLGQGPVTWRSEAGIRCGHVVRGVLSGGEQSAPCDLLAVDQAYPEPVAEADLRTHSHQAWRHGEVLLVSYRLAGEQRLTLAVPGRDFTPDRVLDAVGRLARAVGAGVEDYAVLLRLGADAGAGRHGAGGGPR